jgi:hypothetical protein
LRRPPSLSAIFEAGIPDRLVDPKLRLVVFPQNRRNYATIEESEAFRMRLLLKAMLWILAAATCQGDVLQEKQDTDFHCHPIL